MVKKIHINQSYTSHLLWEGGGKWKRTKLPHLRIVLGDAGPHSIGVRFQLSLILERLLACWGARAAAAGWWWWHVGTLGMSL